MTCSDELHILENANCLYDDWFCSGLKQTKTGLIYIIPNLSPILRITRLLHFFYSLELQNKTTFRYLHQCFSLGERLWRNLLSWVRKMGYSESSGLVIDL
jgi:hypothetical protein